MKCGVIDLGSNTVRLAVFQREGGETMRLLNEQRNVGLASYVKGNALTDDGVEATCLVLNEYRLLLAALGIDAPWVFATASLRNISNTAAVVVAILEKTGLGVDVLSGEDEAALSFRGTLLGLDAPRGVLTDIGGGSTELVTFESGAVVSACSLPFGSLSLFKKYVSGLFPTPTERAAMREFASRETVRAIGTGGRFPLLLGAGGTIQSAAALIGRSSFSADEAARLLKDLQGGSREALLRILRTAPDRVHTLVPGLIVLNAVVKSCGAQTVTVSETDIRDGYFAARIAP